MKIWRWQCNRYLRNHGFFLCKKFQYLKFRYMPICEHVQEKKKVRRESSKIPSEQEMQKDDLITAILPTVSSVWVSDARYKHYTHPIMLIKPWLLVITVPEINQISHLRASLILVREGKLNFDPAGKKTDVTKY